MHSPIFSASVISLVLAAAPVVAQQHTTGEVRSYDRTARTFHMDGIQYSLPSSLPSVGLSDGHRISVSWQQMGDGRLISHFWTDEISHNR